MNWIIIAFAILLQLLFTNMTRSRFQNLFWTCLAAACLCAGYAASNPAGVGAQESSPTPTSGPAEGMFITVISTEPQINVRGGPSSVAYPVVGFLLPGAVAPALGRSPGGDWIQISYPGAPGNLGWVYSPLVALSPGTLRIVEPPPTPIPPPTNTLDPTLAAQFNTVPTTTRLPTFTPPAASIVPPTFGESGNPSTQTEIPYGVMIIVFISLGSTGFLLSLTGRR
jgi:hypothetical protein